MKVALAVPTGNIGSKLAPRLLDEGVELVLLCRDPQKVSGLVARGAKALAGDLEDSNYVLGATQGADALFWLTPPHFTTRDPQGFQRAVGRSAAGAIRQNRINRVVSLSSIGAQMPSGTGPIAGLHEVEDTLNESGASVTHLRAAYFMENWLFSLETIRTAGSVFLPVGGECRIPVIATRDLAEAAARCLLDASWTGRRVLGLHGPVDLSFNEAASILGEAIGRPVRHVRVTPQDALNALVGTGASPEVASKYVEMYQSLDNGTLRVAEPRTPETTTPTTFSEFARAAMKPLLT